MVTKKPNDKYQEWQTAGAGNERMLFAVACMPLLAFTFSVSGMRYRHNNLLNCLIDLLCLISLYVEAEVNGLQ